MSQRGKKKGSHFLYLVPQNLAAVVATLFGGLGARRRENEAFSYTRKAHYYYEKRKLALLSCLGTKGPKHLPTGQ